MLEENVALEENLVKVKENIKAACERAGRDAGEVTLVAVSKMKQEGY